MLPPPALDDLEEAFHTTHHEHFLRRLDRVSTRLADTALEMYRDPDLVRDLVARSGLTADRFAISLDDPARGPFVVVTKGGAFVTCLARGMGVRGLAVLPRDAVDRAFVLRGRREERRRLAASCATVGDLVLRVFEAGAYLSREEFEAVAAFQPLLGQKLLELHLECAATLDGFNQRVAKPRALRAVTRKQLFHYERLFWAMSHLAPLALAQHTHERSPKLQASRRRYRSGARSFLAFRTPSPSWSSTRGRA